MENKGSNLERALIQSYDLGYRVYPENVVVSHIGNTLKINKKNGYCFFTVKLEGINTAVFIHRMVAYEKYGDEIFEPGIMVRHLNGIKDDNSTENIAIGDQSQNMMDIPEHIRLNAARTAASHTRKFTDEEAEEIRSRVSSGETQASIARELEVAKATINYIVHRKTYN